MSFTTQDKEARKFETDPADSSKVVVKTKVENTDSDPIPVIISNADSAVDIQVEVGPAVTIDDSTPVDVNITTNPVNTNATIQGTANVNVTNGSLATNATIQNSNIDVNLTDLNGDNRLPVSVDNTPAVTVSGNVGTTFTNTNIQAYSYVHNGSGFVFEAADSNGKTINLDHTYYTSTEITSLGSSTDINLWLSAYNDSMLQNKYVSTYNDEHEETVFYQHPSLSNGTKCLRLIYQYSTQNSQKVVRSIIASVEDWSFSDEILGTVSVTVSNQVNPNPNNSIPMHTKVADLAFTVDTVGTATISLSGTNASLYHIFDTTDSSAFNSGTFSSNGVYELHVASDFSGSSYSHSLNVDITGDLLGATDSETLSISGTFTGAVTFANEKYFKASTNTGSSSGLYDLTLAGTNKNPFADNNNLPSLGAAFSISMWMQVPSLASSFDPIFAFSGQDTRNHFKLFHLGGKLNASFTAIGSAGDYAFTNTSYNTWQHIVISKQAIAPRQTNYNGSDYFVQIWLNGVAQNPTQNYWDGNPSFTTARWDNQTVGEVYISGPARSYGSPNSYASGKSGRQWKIDELAFYNKQLDQTEVNTIYNGGTTKDLMTLASSFNLSKYFRFGDHSSDTISAGNIRCYDEVGDTVYFEDTAGSIESYGATDSPYVPANVFNTKYVETENSSYLKETVNITMQNSWSISWWYKADSFSGTGDTAHYFGLARAGSDYSYSSTNYRQHGVHVQLRGSNTAYLDFNAPGSSGNGTYMALSSAAQSIANGNWRHCALVWTAHSPALNGVISTGNQNNLKFYVDGTQISLANNNGGVPSMTDTYVLDELRMGRWLSTATETAFKMDEVALFDYALSSGTGGDIEKIYNGGTPADLTNTTGLTAPTRFFRFEDTNDLAKDTINDSTSTAFTNATSKTY